MFETWTMKSVWGFAGFIIIIAIVSYAVHRQFINNMH